MKKYIIYLFALVGLFIVACDPMEDIHNEIQKNADADYVKDTFIYKREVAPMAYTLTDEDYALSSDEGVAKYKNFSEYALPKDFLPEILNQKFTATDAYEMQVTYDFYSKPVVDEENAYVIDTAEYTEMGQGNPNFSDEDEAEVLIAKLLDRKVFAEEAGAEMTVLYTLFSAGDTRYIKVKSKTSTEVLEYDPEDAYELTDADYESIGNGKYNNFYTIEEAQEKLPEVADIKGHSLPKNYACAVYKNNYDTYVVFIYDGSNWMVKQSLMPTSEPLNYALDGDDITNSTWWADPAIKITLSGDDYAVNPETSNYSNFDLRSGQTPGTDEDKLIEMLANVLEANYSPVDDQQYLVSYAYYDGSNGVGTMRMIRTAGVWTKFIP